MDIELPIGSIIIPTKGLGYSYYILHTDYSPITKDCMIGDYSSNSSIIVSWDSSSTFPIN